MLYTALEEHLMKRAIQPNMRDKKTAVKPFEHILEDFFPAMQWRGKKILDIGPGQCDFLDLIKARGAETYGVDFDQAVVELGTLRGHRMTHVPSIQSEWPYEKNFFDGIFCRGSLNCFHPITDAQHATAFLETIFSTGTENAWVWITPFIKAPESCPPEQVEAVLTAMNAILEKNSISVSRPQEAERARYSINYIVPDLQLWRRYV